MVVVLAGPARASASSSSWSAPAGLDACPALERARILFPSDKPDRPTGPGAIVWRAASSCTGGGGLRVARVGAGDTPTASVAPPVAGKGSTRPRGALAVSVAPYGQILIAGSGGGSPIQGVAGDPFAPLGSLAFTPSPLATTTAYLGDAALATPSSDGRLLIHVERYFFGHGFDRSAVVSAPSKQRAQALTIAMDFRTDALAAWAQGGSIYARDMPASGSAHSVQRLARAAGNARIVSLLSDDDRGIVAWSEESRGETSVYVDRSAVDVRFGAPTLLERFRNPDGLPSPAPHLVRLSSESVMIAWGGASDGRRVVRTAAIDLQGVGAPSTISAPAGDALLADLVPGPDGDALVAWTQPRQTPAGPDMRNQSIFTARGFDAYPKRTVFGAGEEVTSPGPNSNPTIALDPANDHALAVWQGEGGALQYAIRSPSKTP